MKVTLGPVQQAAIINAALLGTFQAHVWRQFGAVDPDLNYIFWSPTNGHPGLLHQHGPQQRPGHGDGPAQGTPVDRPADRAPPTSRSAGCWRQDIPYVWHDRAIWAIVAQPNVQNFNNPTDPGGRQGLRHDRRGRSGPPRSGSLSS